MDNERLIILGGQRKLLYERLKLTKSKLDKASRICSDLKCKMWEQKLEYENLDRELAMIDGRYKLLPPKTHTPKKPRELTKDQLLEVARQLGIDLTSLSSPAIRDTELHPDDLSDEDMDLYAQGFEEPEGMDESDEELEGYDD